MNSSSSFAADVQVRPAQLSDLPMVHALQSSLAETTVPAKAGQANWQGWKLDRQTRVAIDSCGQLIGYADLVEQQPGWFVAGVWVDRECQRQGLGTFLLQTMEAQAALLAREDGYHLFAQAWRNQTAARRLLEKAGYDCGSTFQRMQLQLSAPLPAPSLPTGIVIRPFDPTKDEWAAYQADEEAFLDERGKQPRTLEKWRARFQMNTPEFDPTLWFIAWDQAQIAGIIFNHSQNNIGELMHLGVRRPWRRQGLGMALLLHALNTFHTRNIDTIQLNVDAQSWTNAQLLYERIGFQTIDSYSNYIRNVNKS
ncbi:hypothetical protein KDW_54710 [Dictyobacter vulcani]|uniref:N-acetyltransferase domain-containing protein n=1 Tax=Dictyobacter vulcani TaxID=2607529 RepID=A0A5J4KYT5_9CHLR|nr:GNAT family N-acetyltransferase [Dictyobacter vulcani]GER91309.1 hypothetical protein KDW_54710 [Dictyobacter vulcani]